MSWSMICLHIDFSTFRPMPDIDTLMQEWSPEFEELLGKVSGKDRSKCGIYPGPSVFSLLCYHSGF